MPDGSWGYTAEEGLKAVLGAENTDKINRREGAMSPKGMRNYIENAPQEMNVSYSDESRRFAKALLKMADENPEVFLKLSSEGHDFYNDIQGDYDLTGFMYGWAVNAVRYVLSAKPVENPAIVKMEIRYSIKGDDR